VNQAPGQIVWQRSCCFSSSWNCWFVLSKELITNNCRTLLYPLVGRLPTRTKAVILSKIEYSIIKVSQLVKVANSYVSQWADGNIFLHLYIRCTEFTWEPQKPDRIHVSFYWPTLSAHCKQHRSICNQCQKRTRVTVQHRVPITAITPRSEGLLPLVYRLSQIIVSESESIIQVLFSNVWQH